jgi:hypothetical protein
MNEAINWSPGVTLEAVEKEIVLKAFRFYRGNKTATANSLGIAVRTLDNKLEKYEADGKAEKEAQENERTKREEFAKRCRGNVQFNPATGTDILGPLAGIHSQPATEIAAQSDMPMPKRKEVQGVLPAKDASHRAGKNR